MNDPKYDDRYTQYLICQKRGHRAYPAISFLSEDAWGSCRYCETFFRSEIVEQVGTEPSG